MNATTTEVLNTVLGQPTNVKTFRKHLRKLDLDDEEYKRVLYQTVGDILVEKDTLKTILKRIKTGRVGWTHPMYDEVKARIEEHDDYLVTPFEVAEGVVECDKCGSMKTYSYQKQTRSSDEPMTTFSCCVKCGHKMTYSG